MFQNISDGFIFLVDLDLGSFARSVALGGLVEPIRLRIHMKSHEVTQTSKEARGRQRTLAKSHEAHKRVFSIHSMCMLSVTSLPLLRVVKSRSMTLRQRNRPSHFGGFFVPAFY